MLDVYEAVMSRRAVRGCTARDVPRDALEGVLSAAAWAPSASNLQPWHAYVLTGEPPAELKGLVGERASAGDPWDARPARRRSLAVQAPEPRISRAATQLMAGGCG